MTNDCPESLPAREITRRLEVALLLADHAGAITLEYFRRSSIPVERKADDSPVTQADRHAERSMRDRLAMEFPRDGIVGEEHGDCAGDSDFTWVLDPIDGTKSFICGVPLYSVLIGILFESRPVAGVIGLPALGQRIHAAVGEGAWWVTGDGATRQARVSSRSTLEEAVFLTSQVDSFAEREAQLVYEELQRRCYITRSWGDGYGYFLVATGRADVMVDPIMNLWDAAPLLPILAEAGGRFTDWRGGSRIDAGEGVATNALLHEAVLAITRPFASEPESFK